MRNISKYIALIALLFLLGISYLLTIFEFEKTLNDQFSKKKKKGSVQIADEEAKEFENNLAAEKQDDEYSIETYSVSTGWGYKIFKGSQVLINQSHIPAIGGMVHFQSEEQAKRTAKLVISKIRNGSFPPTISVAELDSLRIQY
jgi:hypothetical protein